MSEEELKKYSIDELYAIMVNTRNEFMAIEKKIENKAHLETKQGELDIIYIALANRIKDDRVV